MRLRCSLWASLKALFITLALFAGAANAQTTIVYGDNGYAYTSDGRTTIATQTQNLIARELGIRADDPRVIATMREMTRSLGDYAYSVVGDAAKGASEGALYGIYLHNNGGPWEWFNYGGSPMIGAPSFTYNGTKYTPSNVAGQTYVTPEGGSAVLGSQFLSDNGMSAYPVLDDVNLYDGNNFETAPLRLTAVVDFVNRLWTDASDNQGYAGLEVKPIDWMDVDAMGGIGRATGATIVPNNADGSTSFGEYSFVASASGTYIEGETVPGDTGGGDTGGGTTPPSTAPTSITDLGQAAFGGMSDNKSAIFMAAAALAAFLVVMMGIKRVEQLIKAKAKSQRAATRALKGKHRAYMKARAGGRSYTGWKGTGQSGWRGNSFTKKGK